MTDKSSIAMRTLALFSSLLLLPIVSIHGQFTGVDSLPDKRSVWRLGGGTGLMIPLNLPNTIFRQVGINAQVGVMHEYYWRRRWSLLAGCEYRLQRLVADARFRSALLPHEPANQILVEPAPDSIKYSSLQYQSISIPLMARYYFARRAEKRMFIDFGVSVNLPLGTVYQYRSGGQTRRQDLQSVNRQPIFLLEVAAGANGKIFGGRLTRANQFLGVVMFGAFVSLNLPLHTQQGQSVSTAGFLTRFVF